MPPARFLSDFPRGNQRRDLVFTAAVWQLAFMFKISVWPKSVARLILLIKKQR